MGIIPGWSLSDDFISNYFKTTENKVIFKNHFVEDIYIPQSDLNTRHKNYPKIYVHEHISRVAPQYIKLLWT